MFVGDPINKTGVFVDLLGGTGHFADAEGDKYGSIENVYGSEFNDVIQDSEGDNTLKGEGGDDILITLSGNITKNYVGH